MQIEGEKAYFRRAFGASQSHKFVVFHTEGDRPVNSLLELRKEVRRHFYDDQAGFAR